jgi:hypothetical protein
MLPMSSPTFLRICDALRVKRGYEFEVVCNDYLKARYPNLTPWISTKVQWTIPGTPDAFGFDESGNLIACQYGPQEGWHRKLFKDAEKVKRLAAQHDLVVKQFIFCTTAEISPDEVGASQNEVRSKYGFSAEICGLHRLADDLEKLYPGIAARRLAIPIRLQQFMTLDAYLDSPIRRYWPKRKDVEEGKVFLPKDYISQIETKLLREKRCLLTGRSGSGKTALAIGFSFQWRKNEEKNRKHPEAVIFYLEASPGYNTVERGVEWYQQVRDYDSQNEIFIIDNCNVAPAAVNAFIGQWERKRPEKTLVLLTSRTRSVESPWEEESEDYFDGFEQAEALVGVKPEEIYIGVLKAYSDAYIRLDNKRFVPVEVDLRDPERAAKLERNCAHNLAATRSLLERWYELKGHLSDVTEEAVLTEFERHYLTQNMASALVPLCALAQFHISAHVRFIDQLPSESVNTLRQENLLLIERSETRMQRGPSYGRCYRIDFHPQTAAQIFRAYVRQQQGDEYVNCIDSELFSKLKAYLTARREKLPEVLGVYLQLYRNNALELQQSLLRDVDLQAYATLQFDARPLNEVIWYLYVLSRADYQSAKQHLQDFLSRTPAKALRRRVLALTGPQFTIATSFLVKVDWAATRMLFGNLPAQWVAERISTQITSIWQWISSSSTCFAARLGYSKEWRQQVAEALDLDILADRAQQGTPQNLYWFLRGLNVAAPEQARALVKTFIESFSLADLASKVAEAPLATVTPFLGLLKKLGYDVSLHVLAKALELEILVNRTQQASLQGLFWFLRELNIIAPEQAKALIETFSPTDLARKMTGGPLASIEGLLQVLKGCGCDLSFRRRLIEALDIKDLANLVRQASPQHLVWSLREFGAVAPERAKALLDTFSPADLAEKMRGTNLSSLSHLLQYLDKLGYDVSFREQVTKALDLSALAAKAKEGSPQRLYWLLRDLKAIEPGLAVQILTMITPEGLAKIFRERKSKAKDIEHLLEVCDRDFAKLFLKQFSPDEIADIFQRSPLRHVGILLQYRYYLLAEPYAVFTARYLPKRLEEAPREDIEKFIRRLKSVPGEGARLAQEALELLVDSGHDGHELGN